MHGGLSLFVFIHKKYETAFAILSVLAPQRFSPFFGVYTFSILIVK